MNSRDRSAFHMDKGASVKISPPPQQAVRGLTSLTSPCQSLSLLLEDCIIRNIFYFYKMSGCKLPFCSPSELPLLCLFILQRHFFFFIPALLVKSSGMTPEKIDTTSGTTLKIKLTWEKMYFEQQLCFKFKNNLRMSQLIIQK